MKKHGFQYPQWLFLLVLTSVLLLINLSLGSVSIPPKEILQTLIGLPNENTIYLADSKNAPYGEKSKQQIIDFSIKNTVYLLSNHA
jgi:hypothetical protein